MKQIPGFTKYTITSSGDLYSLGLRKLKLKPTVEKNGYYRYRLIDSNGKKKSMYAHRLVALAYIDNPKNKPQVNHIDNEPSNNDVSNLEWCTPQENRFHAAKQDRLPRLNGETNGNNKYSNSVVERLRQLYSTGKHTQIELSRMFNIPFSTVHVIVKNKQRRIVS